MKPRTSSAVSKPPRWVSSGRVIPVRIMVITEYGNPATLAVAAEMKPTPGVSNQQGQEQHHASITPPADVVVVPIHHRALLIYETGFGEGAGDTTFAFRADFIGPLDTSAAAAEAGMWGVESLPSDSAVLLVKRGPTAGSRYLLNQPATSAGRHPGSDIFLDDVTASRRHVEFRRDNGEFRVVDTGSLNGTYVNREPVQSAVLANGDEIQIGKFRLVFLTNPETG